jgi:integrase/recombinase XerD
MISPRTSSGAQGLRYSRRNRVGKAPGPHAVRSYLRLEVGAELVDIQALLEHVNLATTQIYTHVSEDRMAGMVAKL